MSERTCLFLMTAEQAEAFSRLAEAANRGDGDSACRLGDMYREGRGGLRYSPKQTFRWYSRSALAGDVDGQNNLGACYEHGLGCEQSYVKAVKWYRLAAARQHGTASMNLGYCYLRGKGLPADKEEALRLFRLAVEQGEEKAAKEVERLEGGVTYGRIPKGFKDRTKDRGSLAIVGGDGPQHSDLGARNISQIRFSDATDPGRHLGLVGLAGVAQPEVSAGAEPGTTEPEGATEARMTPEMVPLGQLLPGFDKTLVVESDLTDLKAGFEKFRERTKGKPYIVATFRSSIDIDAFPTDSITIGEAFATEDQAAAEAVRVHDQICNQFLTDTSSSARWEVVGEELPAVSGLTEKAHEPQVSLRVVKSCMTKMRRSWYDIEYVSVFAFELPADHDPVAAVLGEFYFRPYRDELLRWFEDEGRAGKREPTQSVERATYWQKGRAMTLRHLIVSDAGCYEVGNELPEDLHLQVTDEIQDAEQLFRRACDCCKEHVEKQYDLIKSNPNLKLTSDYYWTVLWLALPSPQEVTDASVAELMRDALDDNGGLEPLLIRFNGVGKSREDALLELEQIWKG